MAVETHQENLERVKVNIAPLVKEFLRISLMVDDGEFHAFELVDFIADRGVDVAPSSPTRILQQLKKEGKIDYELVSRRESRYRVISVGKP